MKQVKAQMGTRIWMISIAFVGLPAGPSAWGLGCLTPTDSVVAEVESLGPNPGGLERLSVSIDGFSLADLATTGVGCTIGFSLESQITGAPLWLIQKRVIAQAIAVVDQNGTVHHDFVINPSSALEFHQETIGLGIFSWPMPVAFMPFTLIQNGNPIASGAVTLVFELVVKPGNSLADVVVDIEGFGHVGSDFSVTYGGTTYLLWSSFPMVTMIDHVILLP